MAKDTNKGGFTKSQMKALSKNLNNEVSKFQNALKKLTSDLETLQKGDGKVSYWSGNLAYNWIKTSLAHLDHDKVLLDHVDSCAECLETTIYKGANL